VDVLRHHRLCARPDPRRAQTRRCRGRQGGAAHVARPIARRDVALVARGSAGRGPLPLPGPIDP
jgi:hypothetical protein